MIDEILQELSFDILSYKAYRPNPIETNIYGRMRIDKLSKIILKGLSSDIEKNYKRMSLAQNLKELNDAVIEYCKDRKTYEEEDPRKQFIDGRAPEIPDTLKGLTLNLDLAHTGNTLRFFLTDKNEIVSRTSGSSYIKVLGIKEQQAVDVARKVIPEYRPRGSRGVTKSINTYGQEEDILNTYIPPAWMNYASQVKVKDSLPKSFEKLVNHLFPLEIEREYLFSWIWHSLFRRSFVYLVLCGPPGTGKNRLKLILRALHGHENTIDGKRSTLVERFNSQLSDATLAWFDELSYDMEMENVMKELQNDSISIERKGLDATRSTKIYSSLVVSNNKPRDNFIAFDSRKFAPLLLTGKRLETSMEPSTIAKMSAKVEDPSKQRYDIEYIARIGQWIRNHGRSKKWPSLEYRGPMFYMLAHTSMTRWQKKAVTCVIEAIKNPSSRIIVDKRKGFLWSTVQEVAQIKNGDRSMQFPDYTSIKYFFDIFQDSKGNKAFETEIVKDNIMGDFWIKSILKNLNIVTEADVMKERESTNGQEEEIDI